VAIFDHPIAALGRTRLHQEAAFPLSANAAATKAGFHKKLSQADGGQADGSTRPRLFTSCVTFAGRVRGGESSKFL
jgi:hypothetical protein